jgi:hypothetical protein
MRSDGESVSPKHMQQTTKHPLKKMFLGCFSYHGSGPLVSVDGMMNSKKYIPILVTRIVPEFKKLGASGNAFFQQDLAPCHTSKKVKNFLFDSEINKLLNFVSL